ncbi:anti-sigma factor family protein [Nonomuraea guangzhouensis]|uniref:Anti-sigma factor family protein n=1 Tax=Nonomuraea guangzhouensis TaxID=1291555 RepID=A0ABW4G5B5_9ACTN|nr:zf-HC2 domain-containing protein [Nonomuraea guangzhouensis]
MKRFTCDELVGLITAYLDDALDPAEREGVHTHLACCQGCGRYFEQFRATIVALGDPPPEKLATDVRDRLMSAFRGRRR